LLSAKRLPQGGFLVDQRDGSHCGPSPGCKVDFQEIHISVLEFSSGLLGLYGVWHCHDEAVPFSPVRLDIFFELHPEASTELHSTMQNSHFHHASENGLTVLQKNPKTVSITFPADGITLNFLVVREGERGCFIALKHTLIQGGMYP
jgi:hypothetical protein